MRRLRQHGWIARLLLLNGPPGIGKTTLAQRFVADHPLALNLDIDAIRCSMGDWATHDESKGLARTLAVAMAGVHLSAGHDVVVPQLVARVPFIEVLEATAGEAGTLFDEILLLAPADETLRRFMARRAAMEAAGVAHPRGEAAHDSQSLAAIQVELQRVARERPRTRVIHTETGREDAAYAQLCTLIGATVRPRGPSESEANPRST